MDIEQVNKTYCNGSCIDAASDYLIKHHPKDGSEPNVAWCVLSNLLRYTKWLKEQHDKNLREYSERHNPKALTLEELKERVGMPVWTITNGVEGSGRWEIIEAISDEFIRLCNPEDTTYDCPVDTYGKTWLAYDYPPEDKA